MKITVDVDCTPEEARAFLGLPNLQPMQDKVLQQLEQRMSASLQAVDPQEVMKQWLAPNLKVFERMLEAFAHRGDAK